MTQNTTPQSDQEVQKQNDKEYNFAQIRKQLDQERQARIQAEERAAQIEKVAQERLKQAQMHDDDDDSDEPYIDKKALEKKLNKFSQKTYEETDHRIQSAVQKALSEERKTQWLKNNPDFHEVMQHAQKFAEKDPELAETILEMPEGFERQKLVYKNIKALNLHKKEEPKESIQETINKNQRNHYYQPSGMSTPPYGMVVGGKDYSPAEGQNAYKKMKELQSRLRG